MMIFSEDTEIARSIMAKIALYSVSLLDAGKPSCMASYILFTFRALSVKSTPTPICREAPSTLRIHQSVLLRSASCCRILARKSTNICPFKAKRGLYWIPNLLSSIAHRAILLDKSGLCIVFRKWRLVCTTIECA